MKQLKILLCLGLLTTFCGCQSTVVDVVDLNKVLDEFQATLTELDGKQAAAAKADGGDAEAEEQEVVGIEVVDQEDDAKKEEFLSLFRTKLNAAKLISKPIGVTLHESGTINGFADIDKDNVQDAGEKELFKIEIDDERGRVIASDGGGHYRDHRYRPSGFFTGYLLGSMLGRNRSYYSGARSSMKPNHSTTKMSPKTYHKTAVSKARSAAKSTSTRTRSGSKGFSFGK
jgi:hypothetical protein